MSPKAWKLAAAHLVSSALVLVPLATTAAEAGGFSHSGGGVPVVKPNCAQPCTTCGGNITINKPVTINKNVNIYKPVTINKNVNIYKPVTINKNINITKNIDASKNIVINKNITINKGGSGGTAEASAWASAWASAQASAQASASANVVVYNGYSEYVTINNRGGGGGGMGQVEASGHCEMQEASVVKSIHAVCIAPDGRELPASHMMGDTWIDTGFEGEILRCIPGARLKIVIGDVMQTDQGMAGTYASGQAIECTEGDALRHFKDGMLKCAPKVWVKDCTERSNLRRWGTGDLFFTYRSTVCVAQTRTVQAQPELELNGMSLDGGVGEQ